MKLKGAVRLAVIALVTFAVLMLAAEITLFAVGALFNSGMDSLNQKTASENSDFTILCLGDSTTAIGGKDSWPSLLKEVLEEGYPEMNFSVINKGEILADSSSVLSSLDENIQTYNPDIVIIMIGINDVKKERTKAAQAVGSSLSILRSYKLLSQFWPDIFNPYPIDYANTEKAYSSDKTISNFNVMHAFLLTKNIKLVVMQYPGREIALLEGVFLDKESIIFVDNKPLFDKALSKGVYEDYFIDRFAEDFGHCSRNGNLLIAKNIALNIKTFIKNEGQE